MSIRTLERSSGPGIDPRIAARRDAVRDEKRRRRGRWLVAVAVLAAVLLGAWYITRTPLLDVDHINVHGAGVTTADEIVTASGIRAGEPLLEVDTAASAARIRALPWIDSASVVRNWNGLLSITVTEREPVAIVASDTGTPMLVDRTGRVLCPDGTFDLIDFTIVGPVAGAPGTTIDGGGGALDLAALLTGGVRNRVSTIRTGSDGSIQIDLKPQGVVLVGQPTDLAAKVAELRIALAQVDQRNLASINVVNPQTFVVTRT
jgi:cell division protein FtsQ